MFSKASDGWETPQDFYDALHAEFMFTIDGAATAENTKCDVWLGPGSRIDGGEDALLVKWDTLTDEKIWCNPPYSKAKEFVAWAEDLRWGDNTIVMLLPVRTDTRYFHQYIYDQKQCAWRFGVKVRFLKGRLKFVGAKNYAPFPSMLVIFRSL